MSLVSGATILPITIFAENLFKCKKPLGDLSGKKAWEKGFNPYIELFPHQRRVLDLMFALNPDNTLKYQTYIWSCPKKSGKTTINALVVAWFAFCLLPALGVADEIICAAGSKEHSAGRVYKDIRYAVEHEPLLKKACLPDGIAAWKIKTKSDIEIMAVASKAGTVAGANFSLVSFDELWQYQSEGERMLYEELTPIPTKANSCRFISTYAGVPGQSKELEELYKKMKEGKCLDADLGIYVNEEAGIFGYWDEKARLPWHTKDFLSKQRATLRKQAYLRLWENQWCSDVGGIEYAQWERAQKQAMEMGWTKEKADTPDPNIMLYAGVDASINKDRAAVVTCFKSRFLNKDTGEYYEKVFLGPRMVWMPTKDQPLDFELTIERYLLELQKKYNLADVYFDPYQMVRSGQELWKHGISVVPYNQSPKNGIEMCRNLLDLLSHNDLVVYADEGMTEEAMNVTLKEYQDKGYRFIKAIESRKIDSVIALAMGALAAVRGQCSNENFKDSLMILR